MMKESGEDLVEYKALIQATFASTQELILSSKKLLAEDIWKSLTTGLERDILSVLECLNFDNPGESDCNDLRRCKSIINSTSRNWEELFLWRSKEVSISSPEDFKEVLYRLREVQFNIYILSAWLCHDKKLKYWKGRFLAKKKEQEEIDKNYYFE